MAAVVHQQWTHDKNCHQFEQQVFSESRRKGAIKSSFATKKPQMLQQCSLLCAACGRPN